MKALRSSSIFWILCSCMVVLTLGVHAQDIESLGGAISGLKRAELGLTPEGQIPGLSIAEGITQITGVAISPLWGMSVLGAWKYWHTDDSLRHALPWYCHHYVWGTCFVLLGIGLLKDVLGASVPALIKKPFDFVELFEDKVSAVVASGVFVPLVASAMAQYQQIPDHTVSTNLGVLGMAAAPSLGALTQSGFQYLVFLPLSLAGFAVVWLASHSINVMVALSPFGLVDATLKLIKGALLTSVAVLSVIHPYLGLVLCIPLILVAIPVSGWAFRLSSFGASVGLDLLRRKQAEPKDLDQLRGFSGQGLKKLPVRTKGVLMRREDGKFLFQYRPWLVGMKRTVIFESAESKLERGLLFPELKVQLELENKASWKSVFLMLPRYETEVSKVSEKLGVDEVTQTVLRKGLSQIQTWIREIISSRGKREIKKAASL